MDDKSTVVEVGIMVFYALITNLLLNKKVPITKAAFLKNISVIQLLYGPGYNLIAVPLRFCRILAMKGYKQN